MTEENQDIINWVRDISLSEQRSDPRSKFGLICIEVKTRPNNGIVTVISPEGLKKVFYYKCAFIAMHDGFEKYGIEESAYSLMKKAGFLEPYALLDTYLQDHSDCIKRLIEKLPYIRLEFFIGEERDGKWFTTPDPSATFGDDKANIIIRILNKVPNHFEFIENADDLFLKKPTKETMDEVLIQQSKIFQSISNPDPADKTLINFDSDLSFLKEDKIKQKVEKHNQKFAIDWHLFPISEENNFENNNNLEKTKKNQQEQIDEIKKKQREQADLIFSLELQMNDKYLFENKEKEDSEINFAEKEYRGINLTKKKFEKQKEKLELKRKQFKLEKKKFEEEKKKRQEEIDYQYSMELQRKLLKNSQRKLTYPSKKEETGNDTEIIIKRLQALQKMYDY